MNKYLKMFLFGLITWIVPFVTSFLFFDMETQQLSINEFFFKSIMIVEGGLVGVFLLVHFFRKISENFVREGIIVGLCWFIINILLDVIILLPMSQMDFGTYFQQIGMRYLLIPIISSGMGYVAKRRFNNILNKEIL